MVQISAQLSRSDATGRSGELSNPSLPLACLGIKSIP